MAIERGGDVLIFVDDYDNHRQILLRMNSANN